MRSRIRHLLAAFAFAAFLLPAAASADPGAVVRDCAQDGQLNGSYSNEDKKAALNQIPADLNEYSDCRAIISGAITSGPSASAAGKNGGGGGGGTGATGGAAAAGGAAAGKVAKAKAAKAQQAKRARKAKRLRDLAAQQSGTNGKNGVALQAADTSSGLPTGLLLALIAVGLLLVAGTVMTLRRRVPAFAEALQRVPLLRRR